MKKKFTTFVITIISLLLAQSSFAMGGGGGGGHGMGDSSSEQMHESQVDESHTPVHTGQDQENTNQSHMNINNQSHIDMDDNATHKVNPTQNTYQQDLPNTGD